MKWTNVKVNSLEFDSLMIVALFASIENVTNCNYTKAVFPLFIYSCLLSFLLFSGRRVCLPIVLRNSLLRPVTTSAARRTGRPDGAVLIRRLQILHITSPPRSQMPTLQKRSEASNITPALAKGRFLMEYMQYVFGLRDR